jgi:hypothetical protein
VVQQDFQIFEARIIVGENVAFTIATVAMGEKLMQIADSLGPDRPVPLLDCPPETFGDVVLIRPGHPSPQQWRSDRRSQ